MRFSIGNLTSKIKNWYQGKYIPPPENDPDSLVVIISPGYYKQPFLARVLRQIGNFWLRHWQWILGFIITIALLVVAICTLIHD
jgi:hypothetical protein